MKKWYFTFGMGQLLCDYVVIIEGDYRIARSKMVEQFGRNWAEQYDEEKGEELVEKYDYKIIKV